MTAILRSRIDDIGAAEGNSMRGFRARAFLAICLVLGATACQIPQIYQNKPAVIDPAAAEHMTLGEGGYRLPAMESKVASPELLMFMAFSGGGKRSAAFSYGVLRGLRDMPIRTATGQHRLLDEIDGIGSVSGGTFTSAYYGLHRDRIFADYEPDFLKQDINSYIWGTYLLPWNWGWMVFSYGTNDRMQLIYDDLMFHGATFADLKKNGPPIIWIGATDISYGRVFTFNPENFDLLCSDLDSFPIARAVAASNGFPVLFSPITLANHAKDCGGWRPKWADRQGLEDEDSQARHKLLVQSANDYLDSARTPYVHLADGGVADNLALRGLLNQMMRFEDDPIFARVQHLEKIRRVLIVSVDGQSAQNTDMAKEEVVTGIGQILNAVSGAQIDLYNFETLTVMRRKLGDVVEYVKKVRCGIGRVIDGHRCDDVEARLVHLSLSGIKDEATRKRLESIPTGLTIPDTDVDALVAAGEAAIKDSPEIAEVIKAIE